MKQHEYLEKLNMQAVLNASANEDEFIKELLITHEKVSRNRRGLFRGNKAGHMYIVQDASCNILNQVAKL